MPTPYVVSPGNYVSAPADTISTTTDVAVAPGDRIIGEVSWWGGGSATILSISGGGLEWRKDTPNPTGTNLRIGFISADCPLGLPAGTVITVTFSTGTNTDARGLRLIACSGLELTIGPPVSDTDYVAQASANNWSCSLDPLVPALIIGGAWFDFYTGGITPVAGTNELFEWNTIDGSSLTLAYKEAPTPGNYTIGGTIASPQSRTAYGVAYKLVSDTLQAIVDQNANSGGSYGDWSFEITPKVDIIVSKFTFVARFAGTYTLAINGVTVGSDAAADDENCVITLSTPVALPAGTVATLKITPEAGKLIYFRSATGTSIPTLGSGSPYIVWGNAKFPASGSAGNFHPGTLEFSLDEGDAASILTEGDSSLLAEDDALLLT